MSNHLSGEHSLYLLSHAGNPVDWYPWCEEAFARARNENKPIFLSIGYSSCHWCHVMERESFRSEEVARILNESFVSIKVDREERPDIDAVYMKACSTVNGSSGWPLTVLMSPEGEPFFIGTYLPRENRGGRAGLLSILNYAAGKWKSDRASLLRVGHDLSEMLRISLMPNSEGENVPSFLSRGYEQLCRAYDKEFGGFGTQPKFPAPQNILFLLRYSALSGEKQARSMAEQTLQCMARGGIYDHFGGGFSRYSVDRTWLIPHFEKTLYDNALLIYCYTEAWQSGRFALYRRVAEESLRFCLRDLSLEINSDRNDRKPSLAFCSSLDADSDGFEGAYYLFTPDEVADLLGKETGSHFCECYGISAEGIFKGRSVPNLLNNDRWLMLPEGYDAFREKLRLFRDNRFSLIRDTKFPVGWNGLMLMALSKAAAVFHDPVYLDASEKLCRFLLDTAGASRPETLCAVCYPTASGILATGTASLSDHAFTALGFLEHYRVSFDTSLLLVAERIAEHLLSAFSSESGGYYLTPSGSEKLLFRPLEVFDQALPSSNSACLMLFDLLRRLTGKEKWQHAFDSLLQFLIAGGKDYPAGSTFALAAMMSEVYPTKELLCASGSVPPFLAALNDRYEPEMTLLLKRPDDSLLTQFAPFTQYINAETGRSSLYVCTGGACSEPIDIG